MIYVYITRTKTGAVVNKLDKFRRGMLEAAGVESAFTTYLLDYMLLFEVRFQRYASSTRPWVGRYTNSG
jgi:hypothetical protein